MPRLCLLLLLVAPSLSSGSAVAVPVDFEDAEATPEASARSPREELAAQPSVAHQLAAAVGLVERQIALAETAQVRATRLLQEEAAAKHRAAEARLLAAQAAAKAAQNSAAEEKTSDSQEVLLAADGFAEALRQIPSLDALSKPASSTTSAFSAPPIQPPAESAPPRMVALDSEGLAQKGKVAVAQEESEPAPARQATAREVDAHLAAMRSARTAEQLLQEENSELRQELLHFRRAVSTVAEREAQAAKLLAAAHAQQLAKAAAAQAAAGKAKAVRPQPAVLSSVSVDLQPSRSLAEAGTAQASAAAASATTSETSTLAQPQVVMLLSFIVVTMAVLLLLMCWFRTFVKSQLNEYQMESKLRLLQARHRGYGAFGQPGLPKAPPAQDRPWWLPQGAVDEEEEQQGAGYGCAEETWVRR